MFLKSAQKGFRPVKRILALMSIVMVLGVFLISGCGTQSGKQANNSTEPAKNTAPAEPIKIRWNLDSASGDTLSIRAEKTKQLVESDPELKDKVKIELYYSNSLYKAADAVDALMRGDLQMSFVGAWYLASLAPNISVLETPFLFKDLDSVNKFFDSPLAQEAIYKPLEDKGVKVLAGSPVGGYGFLTTKPVQNVEDMKGIKTRTTGNGAYAVEAFGGVPISLSAADIFVGMQRGTINGADISPISVMDRKLYEVGKYFFGVPIHPVSDVVLANKKWWDGLPKDIQTKLEQYIQEGNKAKREATIKKEQEGLTKLMPEKGVKVYIPNDQQLEKWETAAQPAVQKIVGKLTDKQLVDKVKNMQ